MKPTSFSPFGSRQVRRLLTEWDVSAEVGIHFALLTPICWGD